MTKTSKIKWKKITRRLKSPFKIISGKTRQKSSKELILQKHIEEKMSTSIEWQKMVDSIRDKEENFEVTSNFTFSSKGIDKEMGFGFISESENPVDARVVLQGPNPFLDNHYGATNPKLGDYSPYSQIYNVRRKSKEGISYVFLR